MWKLTTVALSIHEPGEHFSLTLPKALEPCSGVHWGASGTVIQPWAMGTANNTECTSTVPGGAFWEVCHTESWQEEHPARYHVCVPEVGYKFSCTYPSDQVSPFSRLAEWQNKLTQKHFMGLCFSSQLHQAGNVHRLSGHCCPQALRLLQLFISSSTALTSSHLAHSSFLKFDHSSLPIHLQVFLVTQKWVLKTKEVSVPNTSWLTHVT